MTKLQLVFVPGPGIGHLVSSVGFAKQILERNDNFLISMLFINHPFNPSIAKYFESLTAIHTGMNFITIPEAIAPTSLEAFAGSPEQVFPLFISAHKPLIKDAIVNQVMSNNPAAPIASVIVDLSCAEFIDVAKELGLPSHLFFTSNAAVLGLMLHISDREDKGEPKFKPTDPHYVIPYYANPVPYRVLPLFHDDKLYEMSAVNGRKFKDTNGIIVNTFSELESHAVSSLLDRNDIPPIFTVGPLIDHEGKSLTESEAVQRDEIMKWLDDQPEGSVVFLCFGSGGSFNEAQLKEIAIGLEQSGHRFLWSVRKKPSTDAREPGDYICFGDIFPDGFLHYSSFGDIFPDGFLERTKNIGMLCGWAPQVQVLAHKAVGAFVSHCGWNSTLETLWYGVPVITWPLYAEQHTNAFQLVKDLGLAMELTLDFRNDCPTDVVKAEDITEAVRYIMEEGSEYFRAKAKATSELSRRAVSEGGSSNAAFGRLIEQWLDLGNKV